MVEIKNDKITKKDGMFYVVCNCGIENKYKFKASAITAINRNNCHNCKVGYRLEINDKDLIYQNEKGKWCSVCSICKKEQAYTRKDHAKSSAINNWNCKQCASNKEGFSNNQSVGSKKRVYNKFLKSATQRKINWDLAIDDMYSNFNGKCALTNWDISLNYKNCTASLDRIDSTKGYSKENIQWVHSMVNMSKRHYSQEMFIKMSIAIANKYKW